eukprot:TRINITY_DN8775_c0_g2_i1.p1 TRINITY_DN8775_c0_g2~~TRINITY_DN8775_c0_g2_i1.p1  ORF type:complete len:427 (-),score=80.29 TRINITY_DN8775_c0_g2_i1:39-1319(-)
MIKLTKPKYFALKIKFERFLQRARFRVDRDFRELGSLDFRTFDGGREILNRYARLMDFYLSLYPFFRWSTLDTTKVSNHYWAHRNNQSLFLDSISQKLPIKIRQHSDWRHLDYKSLAHFHGLKLYAKNASLTDMLESAFPQFFWEQLWRREHLWIWEQGGEADLLTEKRAFIDRFIGCFCDFVGVQSDLSEVDSLYFCRYPVGSTLMILTGSPQEIWAQAYPELVLSYRKMQKGYWMDRKDSNLLVKAMKMYNIRKKEDWYKLSVFQFSHVYGKNVVKRNMIKLLEFYHPEEMWNLLKFSGKINKRSTQRYLGVILKEMFKGEEVLENYVVLCKLVFDFYVPGRGLMIEYQGEQHYFSVSTWMSFEGQKKRDEEKRLFCIENGLKLVCVPFWWDKQTDSLINILNENNTNTKTITNPNPTLSHHTK